MGSGGGDGGGGGGNDVTAQDIQGIQDAINSTPGMSVEGHDIGVAVASPNDADAGVGPGMSVADVGFVSSLSNSLGNIASPTQGQVDQAIADAHGVADQATQAIAEGKDGQVVQAMVETQQDPTSGIAYALNKGAIALGMHPVTAKASHGAVFGVGGLAARGMAEGAGALSNMMATNPGPSTGYPGNGFNGTSGQVSDDVDPMSITDTMVAPPGIDIPSAPGLGGITDGIGGFFGGISDGIGGFMGDMGFTPGADPMADPMADPTAAYSDTPLGPAPLVDGNGANTGPGGPGNSDGTPGGGNDYVSQLLAMRMRQPHMPYGLLDTVPGNAPPGYADLYGDLNNRFRINRGYYNRYGQG